MTHNHQITYVLATLVLDSLKFFENNHCQDNFKVFFNQFMKHPIFFLQEACTKHVHKIWGIFQSGGTPEKDRKKTKNK